MTDIGYTVIKRSGFDCKWCDAAIDLLDKSGLPYSIRSLGRADLLEAAAHAKMSSIPIIYHGVRLVGGFTELHRYLEEQP